MGELAQIQEECAVAEGGGEGVHIVQHPPVEALHIFLAPGDVVWILLEVLAVKGGQGDHAVHAVIGVVGRIGGVQQALRLGQKGVQIIKPAVVLDGVVGKSGFCGGLPALHFLLLKPALIDDIGGLHDIGHILGGHYLFPAVGDAGGHVLVGQIDETVPREAGGLFLVVLIL